MMRRMVRNGSRMAHRMSAQSIKRTLPQSRQWVVPGARATAMRFYVPDVPVPPLPESVTEGTLQSWVKGEGDAVAEDELLCTIETDKIEIEVMSPVNGTLSQIKAQPDDVVTAGQVLAVVEPGEAPPSDAPVKKAAKEEAPAADAAPKSEPAPSKATPPPAPAAEAPKPTPSAPKPAATGERTEQRVRMSRMRKTVSHRLKDAQNTTAMLTTFQECDMSAIMGLRSRYKEEFVKKHGVKLGFMSAFVRASAYALEAVPAVNAVIDGDDIVYRDYVDISVAVATPKGLVVPVVRDANQLSFADVEATIADLGARARDGKLALEDMSGGTFTISNGGVYGSMMGTPIINPPQSAILGMHNIEKRAVVVNDEVVVRPMMYLALTYDHRLVDGREAVTFLRTIKLAVEDPARMLLGL